MKSFFSLPTLLVTLVCLLAGCAGTSPSKDSNNEESLSLQSIVVLPVQSIFQKQASTPDESRQLTAGADMLDSLLQKYLLQNNSAAEFNFISAPKMEALLGNMNGDIISQARLIAAKLHSDGALIMTVHRFQERVGNSRSVSSPAGVTFEYKLINAGKGAILCSGVFEETQQSLSENIFNFPKASKRGFKWISAEELAREGLVDKLSECPYLVGNEE